MQPYENHVKTISDYYFYTPTTTAKQMYFYPVCLGYFHYEPEYSIKRERYDSFLIMQIKNGSCKITFKNETFIATKNDVVFLDCYEPHQYESIGDWEAIWMHFDGPLARNYYEQIYAISGNLITPRNSEIVSHSLNKVFNIFKNSSRIVEASISKYIITFLTELIISNEAANNATTKANSLSEVITFINEHFAQPITLNDLAKIASLSPYYFTRLFTKETGVTPHQYLLATRINSAKFLLISTTIPVKEIAFKTGFSSESNFCSTFKKWEHATPSEYRTVAST